MRRPAPAATLAAVRKALGITADQLAERVQNLGYHRLLTRADISKYETGLRVPSARLQVLLATAYGLDFTKVTWGADTDDEGDDLDDQDDEADLDAGAPLARTA